jgi:hypothetical protein
LNKREAQTIVRNTILQIGGPKLLYKSIHCLDNENGVSRAAFSHDGKLKMIGIAPPTYWQTDGSRLIALAAHEYANFFFRETSQAEDQLSLELAQINRAYRRFPDLRLKKRLAKRVEYEINKGVLFDQLVRKLRVDAKAIQLLRQHNLPYDGFVPFLTTELRETGKLSLPRRTWQISSFLIRISQAEKIITDQNYNPDQFIQILQDYISSS